MVCRSRAEIRFRQELDEDLQLPDGTPIKFPRRRLNTINYSIIPDSTDETTLDFSTSGEFYSRVDELLSRLTFPQFNSEKFLVLDSSTWYLDISPDRLLFF